MNNEPVAYVIQNNSDNSIGEKIAIPSWTHSFSQQFKKLEEDNWVKNGVAKIIPLYTHPTKHDLGIAEAIGFDKGYQAAMEKTLTDEEMGELAEMMADMYNLAMLKLKSSRGYSEQCSVMEEILGAILRKAQEK